MQPALDIRNLSHSYDGVPVLSDVSFSARGGEFVSIVGPSGCGKTTLLRMLGGLLSPETGTVLIGGEPAAIALARRELGFVFQQPALLPWRTARANVMLPLEIAHKEREGAGQAADRLLARVRLSDYVRHYPSELSGGQAQRVAIARAFAHDPRLLLLDEPFSALDEITRDELQAELLRVREDALSSGATTIFVTHSVPEAVFLSDRVIVLSPRPGKVVDDVAIDMPRRERSDDMRHSLQFTHLVKWIRNSLRAA